MKMILIAGMPRSGSMWTFNITRSLIKASGQTVIPEFVPSDELGLLEKYANLDSSEADYCCIKTHEFITPLNSNVKIICNYRDVRDAMISFMKFTNARFELSLQIAKGMMKITDHYFQVGTKENLLKIRYESLIESNFTAAQLINEFLNLNVNAEDVNNIVQAFSREGIKNKFSHNSLERTVLTSEIDPQRYELVGNFDNSYRILEKETGFQSNHITNTKAKEWQKNLSISQQKALIDLTSDWLSRYGYVKEEDYKWPPIYNHQSSSKFTA